MLAQASTLIVDDNIDAARLLSVLLGQLGENATYRENGREALEYLKNHIPRLILLHSMMPEMSGIQVLQAIRRDPRLAAVPVIMMSRDPHDPGFAKLAKEQGAAEFWVKSEILYKNLKQLLAPYLTRISVMPSKDVAAADTKSEDSKERAN